MVSVLIATRGLDGDSTIIATALAELGHRPLLWMGSNLPSSQTHTVWLDGSQSSFHIVDWATNRTIDVCEADVIWRRRTAKPFPEPTGLIGDDLLFARATGRKYHSSLWAALANSALGKRDVFWVNHWSSALAADSKLLQLRAAHSAGFSIPRTIISNNKNDIIAFIRQMPGTIRKSLVTFSWQENGRRFWSFASDINVDDLRDADNVLPVVEIFQEKIHKRSELRISVLGRTFFAVEIESSDGSDLVDFRVLHHKHDRLRIVELGEDMKSKILALFRSLGIVAGVVEIMIDQDGRYVFTEINESGQSLWISNAFPDHPILDAFTRFLVSRDPDFIWAKEDLFLTADYVRSVPQFQEFLHVEKAGLYAPLEAAV